MISVLIEILATVCDTLLLVWFVSEFCAVPLKKRPWTLAVPAVQLAAWLIFDWSVTGFSLIPATVMFGFSLIFALLLSPKTVWWDLVAALSFAVILFLLGNLSFSIFTYAVRKLGALMQNYGTLVRILYVAITKLVLFFIYRLVLLMSGRGKRTDTSVRIMTLVLTFATIITSSALSLIAAAVENKTVVIPIIILALSIVAADVLLYMFIYKIYSLNKAKHELDLINERIAIEKKQAEEAELLWNNIRKVRHDLGNHLSVIRNYAEQGENEACCKYIDSIKETVESMVTLIRSGNTAVDFLINSKLSGQKDVQILISGNVGDFNDIAETDMVCILGNILDNAIEAVKSVTETKRIELYFSKMNKNRLIICKNSVSDPVLHGNSSLHSTKKNASKHGLGHQIVEATVKKYGGLVDYFEETGLFGVEISIPESH